MSQLLEHDYIGISEASSMESSEKTSSTTTEGGEPLNLKETELRLGLPGSMSPERRVGGVTAAGVGVGLSLQIKGGGVELGVLKNFSSGAKRGFSDAIDGSGKWGFPGNGGGGRSEGDLGKGGGVMFSPRGGNGGGKPLGGLLENGAQQPASAMKDVVPPSPKALNEKKPQIDHSPPAKAQVVGWPPIRSFRKNTMAANPSKNTDDTEGKSGSGCLYVKVSMDGAPYLRKVDLRTYSNYMDLSSALEKMFSCFTIGHCSSHGEGLSESRLRDLHVSEYVLTYEDKDSDWMLVGDVPWDMFIDSCKRLRIMKGSEAIGLALCKNRNQQHD